MTCGRTTGRLAETDIRLLAPAQGHRQHDGSRLDFQASMRLVFGGRVQPVVDEVFVFPDAAAAYARLASGEQFGKVVLRMP